MAETFMFVLLTKDSQDQNQMPGVDDQCCRDERVIPNVIFAGPHCPHSTQSSGSWAKLIRYSRMTFKVTLEKLTLGNCWIGTKTHTEKNVSTQNMKNARWSIAKWWRASNVSASAVTIITWGTHASWPPDCFLRWWFDDSTHSPTCHDDDVCEHNNQN